MPTYKWPREYTRKGVKYTGVCQSANALIYKCHLEKSASPVWYEVFQRKINSEYTVSGVTVPAGPALPSASAFGSWAWTYPTLQQAIARGKTIKAHKSIIGNAQA